MRRLLILCVLLPFSYCAKPTSCDTGAACDLASLLLTFSRASFARYALVANTGSNTIRSYSINPSTGALSLVSTATAGASIGQAAFDTNTSSVFVPETSNGYVFSLGSSTGVLSQIQVQATAGLGAFVLDGNRHAYALTGSNLASFTIQSDGTLLSTGSIATLAGAQTPYIDPTGRYIFIANAASTSVNTHVIGSNGAAGAALAYTAPNANAQNVRADNAGRVLYMSHGGSSSLTAASIGSGGALTTLQAGIGTVSNPGLIEVDSANKYVYENNLSGNTLSVFQLNGDGTLTFLQGPATPGAAPGRVILHPTIPVAYSADQSSSQLAVYARGSNGFLSQIQTVTIGTGTAANQPLPTIEPRGKFLYVSCATTNDLYVFSINQLNGQLTLVQTLTGFTGPRQVVLATYMQY